VKGSIHNAYWFLQTNSDVFWDDKLASNFPGDDERDPERLDKQRKGSGVTNFIGPYLHQFSIDSHSLNGYGKPLKRPFDRYQSCLEAINNGRDIRQINW